MRCLLLGSVFGMLVLLFGCKGKVDDYYKAEWVFVNKTAHDIEIVSKAFNSFVIAPNRSHTYTNSGLGPKNMEPDNFTSPYSFGDKIMIGDREEHILTEGESITDVKNYIPLKLEYNYYRFTYAFTESSIQW